MLTYCIALFKHLTLMNPVRKFCIEQAALIWKDQPSLGMLETINEVRVALRGNRQLGVKAAPGAEVLTQWFNEAIAAGELAGPGNSPRGGRLTRARDRE